MRYSDTIFDVAHLQARFGAPDDEEVGAFSHELGDVESRLVPYDNGHVFVARDESDEDRQVFQALFSRASIFEVVDDDAAPHWTLFAGLLVVHHGREPVEIFEARNLREYVGGLELVILACVPCVFVNYEDLVERRILMNHEVERESTLPDVRGAQEDRPEWAREIRKISGASRVRPALPAQFVCARIRAHAFWKGGHIIWALYTRPRIILSLCNASHGPIVPTMPRREIHRLGPQPGRASQHGAEHSPGGL